MMNTTTWASIDAAIAKRDWLTAEQGLLVVLKQSPFDPKSLFFLGAVCNETGRRQEAIRFWRKALAADPRCLPAMVSLGQALVDTGMQREAVRYFEMALLQQPGNPRIIGCLAMAMMGAGDPRAALELVEEGLSRVPDDWSMQFLRSQALREQDEWAAASRQIASLLDTDRGRTSIHVLHDAVFLAGKLSDWEQASTVIPRLLEVARTSPTEANPQSLACAIDEPDVLGRLGRMGGNLPVSPRPPRRWTTGTMTVGYLSSDYREHPVAHMLEPVIRHHSRDRVRVIAVLSRPADGSYVSEAIRGQLHGSIDITSKDDEAARRAIVNAGIDVLVDLNGRTRGHRQSLLSSRPCPVQVLWMGSPCTTGASHYDGFIVDEVVAPQGYDAHCSEPLVRLPVCYHPISSGCMSPDSQSTVHRAQFGIPEDCVLVGMLHNADRIIPPLITRVVECLGRNVQAHLWLRVAEEARERVLVYAEHRGLPRTRIHFAPYFPDRSQYAKAVALIDIIVDPYPYGGHSTTGEAVCLGVPVLTRLGNCIHSRVGASILQECGLGDLVCADLEAQLGMLETLLTDQVMRSEWRRRFADAGRQSEDERHRRLVSALEDTYERLLREAPGAS